MTYLDPGHPRQELTSDANIVPSAGDVALRNTVEAARALEEAGFHRYWCGEHHVSTNFHSTPLMLASILAASTSRIRVGTAGVLLPFMAPFRAAEAFRALANWFPDRVDAGVAKGPGSDEAARPYILREDGFDPQTFRNDIATMLRFMAGEGDAPISPPTTAAMQAFCHSGNPETLEFAARQGLGIGIPLFLGSRPLTEERLDSIGEQVQRCYLDNFQPNRWMPEPTVVAVESLVAVEDPRDAAALRNPMSPWRRSVVGTPDECLAHVHAILERTHATEAGIFQAPMVPAAVAKTGALLLAAEAGGADRVSQYRETILEPVAVETP